MEIHQRPGVYTDYTLSAAWSGTSGTKTVGVAGVFAGDSVLTLRTLSQVQAAFSEADTMRRICQVLLRSGAGSVVASPAAGTTAEDYSAALERLLGVEDISYVVLDSEEAALQETMKQAVEAASDDGRECIGICGISGGTVETMTARAEGLNSPRMVLVGGSPTLRRESEVSGGIYGAAAVAGVLAGETDPAMPLSGAVLSELGSVPEKFTEAELDSLISGGVTVLETMGSEVAVVRGVTTCTKVDGVSDSRFLELTTICIMDDVIPGVRQALKSRFLRKKNNAATRGAIGDQVAVELENRLKREIIDSYGDITVEVSSEDPTVCLVSFGFTVMHGLSRIFLTAHITV